MNQAKPIVKAARKTTYMSGFSTKYALTNGISPIEIDLEYGSDTINEQVPKVGSFVYSSNRKFAGAIRQQMVYGKTFFETLDEALDNARKQASKKYSALVKQQAAMLQLMTTPKMASDTVDLQQSMINQHVARIKELESELEATRFYHD